MKYCIIVVFCFLVSSAVFAQKKTKIDSLKMLGRDSLINLAVKKLNASDFIWLNYDRIIVKASSTSLIVEFSLSIILFNKKSCFYDQVIVALVGSGTGKGIKGECENPKFYNLSQNEKKKLDFVFDAINKSNEIGHIPGNKLAANTKMEIEEHHTYYYVEVSSWSTFSHYKIDKGSGKIYEAGHKHYDRSREEKNEFEIIK